MSAPGIDPRVEHARPEMIPESLPILKRRRDTADTFTFMLDAEPMGGFDFAPGQFNMIYAFGAGEVPISMSGDPGRRDRIVHTIRAVGTVTRALEKLRKGDEVGLRGPFGVPWPLARARGRDVVLVAGGIGLAPLRPVLYSLMAERERYGRVVLIYGARSPADLLFTKALRKWRGRLDAEVEITVDRADDSWKGRTGVVTKLLDAVAFDPSCTVAMLCGPEVMMRFATRDLEARGVPETDIYVSLERNMKCAVGTCGHCQLSTTLVCRDGPVFPYPHVAPLLAVPEL